MTVRNPTVTMKSMCCLFIEELSLHKKISEVIKLSDIRLNISTHIFILTEYMFPLEQKILNLVKISFLPQRSKRDKCRIKRSRFKMVCINIASHSGAIT